MERNLLRFVAMLTKMIQIKPALTLASCLLFSAQFASAFDEGDYVYDPFPSNEFSHHPLPVTIEIDLPGLSVDGQGVDESRLQWKIKPKKGITSVQWSKPGGEESKSIIRFTEDARIHFLRSGEIYFALVNPVSFEVLPGPGAPEGRSVFVPGFAVTPSESLDMVIRGHQRDYLTIFETSHNLVEDRTDINSILGSKDPGEISDYISRRRDIKPRLTTIQSLNGVSLNEILNSSTSQKGMFIAGHDLWYGNSNQPRPERLTLRTPPNPYSIENFVGKVDYEFGWYEISKLLEAFEKRSEERLSQSDACRHLTGGSGDSNGEN